MNAGWSDYKLETDIISAEEKIPKGNDIFLLLTDMDGTTFSKNEPFGVAVSSEDEAKRFVKEGTVGYSHWYEKIRIFDNVDDAVKWRFKK